MEIRELLQKPLEGLNKYNVQDTFAKIAKKLFDNFCIRCGETKYYFAEIEFYYYDKEKFNQEWNKKTYPRTKKRAGDLFFHYSGFDICFDSDYGKGQFGGILIRSLFDTTENRYITGPLLCVNEVLNSCVVYRAWPEIVFVEKEECELGKPIVRYGISYKDKDLKDIPLCFFDKKINCTNSFNEASWDFTNKEPKTIKRQYHRFL